MESNLLVDGRSGNLNYGKMIRITTMGSNPVRVQKGVQICIVVKS